MSIKDRINAIFNSENVELEVVEKVEKQERKFESIPLLDGNVIEVEPALEVGAAAMVIIGEDILPAPDGEHILADNTVIVTEGGLISAITPAEEAVEEEVEELDSEATKTPAQEREAKKVIESIVTEKQFSELKEKFEALEKSNDFLKKELETVQAGYTDKFEKFADLLNELFGESKQEPIVKRKNPLKKETKNIFLAAKKNK